MGVSALDLFNVGIGPSSSHTVGPMRAARAFAADLREVGLLESTTRVRAELFGSLGATGRGHGADLAVVLGLLGETPEDVDPVPARKRAAEAIAAGVVNLLGLRDVDMRPEDLVLHRRQSLPYHPNGMRFMAFGESGAVLTERTSYSVGGGFVVDESADGNARGGDDPPATYPFKTAADLCGYCAATGLSVSEVRARGPIK